jgi:hypothetical protein
MGGNVLHNLAHAVFILSKISYSTKPMVFLHFSTTASFQLRPTVRLFDNWFFCEAVILFVR